ncbi:class I SAM-dependent methyltransferase [Lysinibacillus fusiformis]|uniref:class I SAM-dependent methyltransferase n=1 Tax=Lysinibacillus fusiformis TaxID=28031 RepID=UPI0018E5FD8F|nr:methyltransferase [Lysinibacillus fusiformis]MBI6863579.1 class I SAM-dependent methyltransferase [Lysinibacillus fusiformis]
MGWREIWCKEKEFTIQDNTDKTVYLELKRLNGFDVLEGTMTYESFLYQHNCVLSSINIAEVKSVFEVGCGSGANLYMFSRNSFKCGGLDYAPSLLKIAEDHVKLQESQLGEAKLLNTEVKYDLLYSNSVFSYFPNLEYASGVLDKMYEKTNKFIVLLDIHDKNHEEAYHNYRRKNIRNYDEVYKGLDKLFYEKNFFEAFAIRNGLKIEFTRSDVPGYWNNDFVFNCYMYK